MHVNPGELTLYSGWNLNVCHEAFLWYFQYTLKWMFNILLISNKTFNPISQISGATPESLHCESLSDYIDSFHIGLYCLHM